MGQARIYRIYCFDGLRHVWAADCIEAPDDGAAVEAAKGMDGGVKKEVWRGRRLIASLDGAPRAAEPRC